MKLPTGAIEIFLQPGEYYFGDQHTCIRTVLGSCVAITLWHPQRRIGGMCHYMLPVHTCYGSAAPDGRYAEDALVLLMKEIAGAHSKPEQYVVKLFGGSQMFALNSRVRSSNVGLRNAVAGERLLNACGITCSAVDTGGHLHRHVVFDVQSGEVWVRKPVMKRRS